MRIFEQLPDPTLLNDDHDVARRPVGRMYNKRLVRLEDGDLAVIVDVDLEDDAPIQPGAGYSVGFTSREYTLNPDRRGDMTVVFNPRMWDAAEFVPLMGLSDERVQIDVVEIEQRSVEWAAIVVLKFAAQAAAAHFIGRAAERACKALAAGLCGLAERRREVAGQETIFQLHFELSLAGRHVPVVLSVSPENLTALQEPSISVDDARDYVARMVGDSQVQRVALRFEGDPPGWRLDHFVEADGKVVVL